ncbi:helix-turn-helix transcriptional regulator [Cupriavidus sp. 2KB_3]|uniref:helix-turn-helix transcriptional regulator n=1 Tax=Cupriavidus sp. 2KB_3 TaxID=3232980 RepID=UPI003F8EE250
MVKNRPLASDLLLGRIASAFFGPIHLEHAWRQSKDFGGNLAPSACVISRWTDERREPRALTSPILAHHYTVEILLSNTMVDCTRNGHYICTRAGRFGGTQVTPPGQQVICRFERPCDALHLFLPGLALDEAVRGLGASGDQPALHDPGYRRDMWLGRIAQTLAETGEQRGPVAEYMVASLVRAVIAHLINRQIDNSDGAVPFAGLQPWRLNKAIDFIEENAGEPITLNDMASHVELSRMHFAAQFRRATGLSPHAYLNRSRIERAKNLLVRGHESLAEIALQVGFSSQSYFTTVFRKHTGLAPGQWRMRQMRDARLPLQYAAGFVRENPAVYANLMQAV